MLCGYPANIVTVIFQWMHELSRKNLHHQTKSRGIDLSMKHNVLLVHDIIQLWIEAGIQVYVAISEHSVKGPNVQLGQILYLNGCVYMADVLRERDQKAILISILRARYKNFHLKSFKFVGPGTSKLFFFVFY